MASNITADLPTIAILGAIGVGAYLVYEYVLPGISTLGNIGADVSSAFGQAGADIGNPLTAAQGNGTGFFGAVFSVGQSIGADLGLNNTAATEAQWNQEIAYNDQTTTAETQAVAQVDAANTSGDAAAQAQALYNELMVEVNAYDGAVAPLLTFSRYNALISAGLTLNQINALFNALQSTYASYGANAPAYIQANNATVTSTLLGLGLPASLVTPLMLQV